MIKAGIAMVQFNPCPNPWPTLRSSENTISCVNPGVWKAAPGNATKSFECQTWFLCRTELHCRIIVERFRSFGLRFLSRYAVTWSPLGGGIIESLEKGREQAHPPISPPSENHGQPVKPWRNGFARDPTRCLKREGWGILWVHGMLSSHCSVRLKQVRHLPGHRSERSTPFHYWR